MMKLMFGHEVHKTTMLNLVAHFIHLTKNSTLLSL